MKRYKNIKIASVFGLIGNVFLFVIKIIVGLATKNQGMIADASNSGGDILSSFITFIGNKIASRPKDDDHNLGHGKAEYIFSLIISLIMMVTSLVLIKSSIESIIYKKEYSYSIWLIIVCVITIVTKFVLYLYTKRFAKKYHNLLLEANSKDHLNDIYMTSINLIAVLTSFINVYYFDGIVGIVISIMIFITSLKIFLKSYDVLMDKAISDEVKEEVFNIIKEFDSIKKIQHFNSTPVGYQYQISLTIFVDGNMKTYESHKIADDLEKEIIKRIDEIYLAVIHVNPIDK